MENRTAKQRPVLALNSAAASGANVVGLLMFVVAIGHFNRVGMAVAGTERIMDQYAMKQDQMGLIYSAFLLCYTVAMLPGGWLIDRFGARTALMVFMFGSTLFVALTGCAGLLFSDATSLWLSLIIVRSLMGAVNAPLHPSAARMVFDHVSPHSRSFANGVVTFSACVGIAATYYGLGKLMDEFDWPRAFLISSVLTLVIAILWTVGTRHAGPSKNIAKPSSHPVHDWRVLLRMLGRCNVICITLSYAALGYFQYLFFYWIQYYLETIQHQDRDVARRYTTVITLAMGVGMVCGGWLADQVPTSFSLRMRRSLVPILGLTASGLVFEVGLLTSDLMVTIVALAITAALIGACEGAFWTTVVEIGAPFGGTAAGLMNTGGNAGGALSPYITPLLGTIFAKHYGEVNGWRMSLAVAGVIALLGALLWLGVDVGKTEEEMQNAKRKMQNA